MKRLLPVAAALLCSCVSGNYRAVASFGRYKEGVAVADAQGLRCEYSEMATVYRCGESLYVPAMRVRFTESYSIPNVGMCGQSGPEFGTDPLWLVDESAPREHGYCRLLRMGNLWQLDTTAAAWCATLLTGARRICLPVEQRVQTESILPPLHHTTAALYSYPLATLTFVGVDAPCAVVMNALMAPVWVVKAAVEACD